MRALLLTAALLAIARAAPAQSSPWYVGTALAVNHDNNMLRLDRDTPLPQGQTQADTVTSLALVGGIDQAVGRQRFTGNMTLRDNRFERNDIFNNQSYSGALGWQGSSVNRVSGSLSVGAARGLSTFNATGVGPSDQRNYETTQGFNGSLSLGVVTPWSVEVGAGKRQVRNSASERRYRSRDHDQDNASLGLTWRPSDLINFGLSLREVHGSFPHFIVDDNGAELQDRFKQRQLEFSTQWQASGASVLNLRLSSGDTGYQTNAVRDFGSTSGSIGWTWRPSGQLRLISSISRDDGRDNYAGSFEVPRFCRDPQGFVVPCPLVFPITITDRRQIDALTLQADWQASAKIALSSSFQRSRRSVEQDRLFLNGNPVEPTRTGVDTTTIVTLSARWAPVRSTLVGCELRDERRAASGAITGDLRGTGINCNTQVTLQ